MIINLLSLELTLGSWRGMATQCNEFELNSVILDMMKYIQESQSVNTKDRGREGALFVFCFIIPPETVIPIKDQWMLD